MHGSEGGEGRPFPTPIIFFISQVLSFVSEYHSRESLPELVYPKYSIESISFILITDCILGMRNRLISERCDYGY